MDSLNFNSVETLSGYKPKEASLWFVHALYSAYPNKLHHSLFGMIPYNAKIYTVSML